MRSGVLVVMIALGVFGSACTQPLERATEALTVTPSPSRPGPAASMNTTTQPPGAGRLPIVVRTPRPGDEVVSPITIDGTADILESTLSIRILDARGQELAATFTTSTCGSGCRGAFSAELSFFVRQRQAGTVEVFGASAEEGSSRHVVSVPVVLVPGG